MSGEVIHVKEQKGYMGRLGRKKGKGKYKYVTIYSYLNKNAHKIVLHYKHLTM